MKLVIKQVDKRAVMPSSDIFDIYMIDTIKISPGETRIVRTGLELKIPAGFGIILIPNISLGINYDIIIPNSSLILKSGELTFPVRNISRADQLTIKAGTNIAQGVLLKLEPIDYEIEKLS